MEIQLASERLFLLEERMTIDEIQQRAMDRRTQAFGGGLGSLLQRPKAEDVVLSTRQRRLEPFWHVAARATYVYDRNRDYTVPGSSPEVSAVTIHEQRHELDQAVGNARAFRFRATEHCRDEFHSEAYTDGLTGAPIPEGPQLVTGPRSEVSDPQAMAVDETIVLPPEQRASFVVRKTLSEVMKPVQADTIIEESIVLDATDLYYRAVWAFEYTWRDKRGIVEIDSVSGQVRQGKALASSIKGMLSRDVLFDVGADTVGLFVPGGSIAVKLAKAAIDKKQIDKK